MCESGLLGGTGNVIIIIIIIVIITIIIIGTKHYMITIIAAMNSVMNSAMIAMFAP